jgi:ubiquinone biosynthesis protein COQ4
MTLQRNPERTDAVFEILDALEGPTSEANFRDFAARPEGRRLLAEKPSLLDALSDHDALARLPEGSFGRAYLAFMREANLNARDLVEAEIESGASRTTDPDLRWLADRGRDSHDLWHVLSGYGRDEAGEIALLAFTYARYPNLGIALILLVAAALGPKSLDFWWPRYIVQAWRRGRAAALDFAPYEEWLALPLEEVRRRARIVPPEKAHPGHGIVAANRGDAGFAAA